MLAYFPLPSLYLLARSFIGNFPNSDVFYFGHQIDCVLQTQYFIIKHYKVYSRYQNYEIDDKQAPEMTISVRVDYRADPNLKSLFFAHLSHLVYGA